MKLFGGSKNGRHTGNGEGEPAFQSPERRLDETVYFDAAALHSEEPEKQSSPQPPVEPPRGGQSPAPNSAEEDGFISSIVEAVGLAEEKPQETKEKEKRAPRKPEASVERGGQPPMPPESAAQPGKMSKGKKAGIIAGSILGVVLLIVLATMFVLKMWITPPSLDDPMPTPTPSAQVDETDPGAEEPEEKPASNRKDGCYTFAVVGEDVYSGSTDTIMVGRLDTVNGTMNVVSIPRDTLINKGGAQKINSAYAASKNNGGNGVDGILKELKKLLGFDIDSYAIVDTVAVAELVDAIGGVEFDVPVNMYYEDPYQGLSIHIDKGLQTLNGENAVKVLRFRGTYAGGDIQRIGVQQDFMKALAKQMLSLGNIPNLNKAVQIYEDRVTTNLTTGNVAFYVREFLKLDMDKIQFMTLPGNTNASINGGSFVVVDVEEWLAMVNEYLNPFKVDVTEENVSIKTYSNGNYYYTAGANQ